MSTFQLALGLLIILFFSRAIAVHNHQFEQFYPQTADVFTGIMANNCSSIFHQYLETPDKPLVVAYRTCALVIDCVLSNSPESIKANMASASVVLGLLPTIIALLGSTTPELSLLSSRRPLLAFLLSIGSPTVNPVRTFKYHDPVLALQEGRSKAIRHTKFQSSLIVLLQYLALTAAVTNVWTVTWQLAQKTIMNISCGSLYLETLWVGFAVVVHFFGTIAFATRSKTKYPDEDKAEDASLFRSTRAWLRRWPRNEFSLCATHTTHILSWRKENNWFLVISWFTSVATVCHIIYGTAILSSAIFIGSPLCAVPLQRRELISRLGVTDTLTVAARYTASVLVCRMIVAYELHGMRAAVRIVEEEGELEQGLTYDTSKSVPGVNVVVPKGQSKLS
jgi:hypothetical protein